MTIKRYTLLFILFTAILFSSDLFAQSKAGRLISNQKYERAETYIRNKLAYQPDDVVLLYNLGYLYSLKQFPDNNTDTAWKYLSKAHELYLRLGREEKQKMLSDGISEGLFRRNMKMVIKQAFKEATEQADEKALRHYLDTYNHPYNKYYSKAEQQYELLLLTNIKSVESYVKYLEEHPFSPYSAKVEDSLYHLVTPDKTIAQLLSFISTYPKNRNFDEAFRLILEYYAVDGEMSTLLDLAEKYPFITETVRYKQLHEKAFLAWRAGLTSAGEKTEEMARAGVSSTSEGNYELKRRLTREGAQTGALQISLMWNNYNDLDLHCIDPYGEEIWYKHRSSFSGGRLDVDMNIRYNHSNEPIENIFWPYNGAPPGTYQVYLRHFLNHGKQDCEDPTSYEIRILEDGVPRFINGEITFQPGKPRILIDEFVFRPGPRILDLKTKSNRLLVYEYLQKSADTDLGVIAAQRFIKVYLDARQFDKAVIALDSVLKLPKVQGDLAENLKQLRQMLDNYNGSSLVVKNLGSGINSKADEYSPVISADEQTIYFCGNGKSKQLGKEDVFYSEYQSGKGWGQAKLMKGLNTAEDNEAPLSISPDGNSMLLFREGDIYISQKGKDGWSSPVPLPEPVNTIAWEGDACLTADGKAIIFASDRAGGTNRDWQSKYYHGDLNYASDLYISFKTVDGWSEPIGLGLDINTPFCERSPFLHPDMTTLYFSSDGHYGMGKLDVFMVRRLDKNSWTSWSDPINMGPDVNSTESDWGYNFSTSGLYAYASKSKEGRGEEIVRYSIPDSLRPNSVVKIFGLVSDYDESTLEAEIKWEDLLTGEEIGTSKSNADDGKYFIVVPQGRLYGYFIEKDGYYPVSRNVDLRTDTSIEEYEENIKMLSVKKMTETGQAVRINNIFFDYDKAILKPESYPELNRLALFLKQYPQYKIEIMGHTDADGSAAYNQKLSELRAKAVMSYLIESGIPVRRLSVIGYGESKPIADNKTDEGKSINRRVEFRFVK